jgi:hypothetical protein
MQRQQNNIKMGLIKIGIRIIQSNTSFLLLKYTYIQGYMFQLHRAIIRPLLKHISMFGFVQLGSQEFTVLKYIAYGGYLNWKTSTTQSRRGITCNTTKYVIIILLGILKAL